MRSLRKLFAITLAAALFGNAAASAIAPAHHGSSPGTQITVVGQHHDCCSLSGNTDCAFNCLNASSCDASSVLIHTTTATSSENLRSGLAFHARTDSPPGYFGLLESPPPRA
jgi:hypothetical protein